MTIRTETELLNTLFADGQPNNGITAGDMRDFIESVKYMGGQGWDFHLDGEYTSVAPRTIASGVRTQITIDGAGADMGHPLVTHNGGHFWNITTNQIIPSALNDFGMVRLAVTGRSVSAPENRFDVELDIGGGTYPIIFKETASLLKGIGNEQSYNFIIPLFAGPEFVANGGTIYITPQYDAQFWEFGITAVRIYAANPAA